MTQVRDSSACPYDAADDHAKHGEHGVCRADDGADVPVPFVRRPMVGIALAWIFGIGLGNRLSPFCWPFLFTAIACVVLGALLRATVTRRGMPVRIAGPLGIAFVYAAVTALGLCVASLEAGRRLADRIPVPTEGVPAPAEIVGTVIEDITPPAPRGLPARSPRFIVSVTAARAGGAWLAIRDRVTVRWRGAGLPETPFPGQRWSLAGKLGAWRPVPGAPPRWTLWSNPRKSRRIGAEHPRGPLSFCMRARRNAAERLAAGIEDYPDSVALLHALLLGYRHELRGETKDLFVSTGTLHIFAVSGLHVGLAAGILVFVLRAFKISRVTWVLFLAPLLIGYTIATGARASAVRACIMAIVYFLGPFLNRKPDPLSAIALAAILILAVSPAQLHEVGFIFSFVVVTGLVLLYPHFERPLRRVWQADELRVQAEPKRMTILRGCGRKLASLIALSCSAWLVSAPLTAYFFGRINPIGLLSNVIVIPLAFLIVLAGSLSLVFGSLFGILTEIFNHANVVLISALLRVTGLLSSVPFGSIQIAKPPLWGVLAWYGVLALAVAGLRLRIRRIGQREDEGGPREWD